MIEFGWGPNIRKNLEQPFYPIERSGVFDLTPIADDNDFILVVIDQTVTFWIEVPI